MSARRLSLIRSQSLPAVAFAALAFSLLLATPAIHAQEDDARVFVRYTGSDDEIAALEDNTLRFERVIHQNSEIRFAGTTEMDTVYAQCSIEIGASVSEQRECQLQAARRLFVDYVVELGIERRSRGQYELTVQVWNPESNERVHGDLIDVEADSLDDAAREGMPLLAHSYLCSIGIRPSCRVGAAAQTTDEAVPIPPAAALQGGQGQLVIEDVEPAPLSVYIDGVLIGQAPGEFHGLPTGEVELTLSAEGYEDASQTVVLSGFQVSRLSGVSLEPLAPGSISSKTPPGTGLQRGAATAPLVAEGRIEDLPFAFRGHSVSELRTQCESFWDVSNPGFGFVDDIEVNGRAAHYRVGYWTRNQVCDLVSSIPAATGPVMAEGRLGDFPYAFGGDSASAIRAQCEVFWDTVQPDWVTEIVVNGRTEFPEGSQAWSRDEGCTMISNLSLR